MISSIRALAAQRRAVLASFRALGSSSSNPPHRRKGYDGTWAKMSTNPAHLRGAPHTRQSHNVSVSRRLAGTNNRRVAIFSKNDFDLAPQLHAFADSHLAALHSRPAMKAACPISARPRAAARAETVRPQEAMSDCDLLSAGKVRSHSGSKSANALNRCRDSRCAGVPVGGVGSELRARL
jgi:hypothetical protein